MTASITPAGQGRTANLLALGAVALWSTLAALGVQLSHVPPFLLTGLALMVGGLVALPLSRFQWRAWRVPARTLALGVYGLFGFHFLLFIALRHAPPVQANLINYLWPLGIVLMAPLFLPGVRLHALHVLAALMGFAGAALAILGGVGGVSGATGASSAGSSLQGGFAWGYVPAAASAFVWASYSLLTRRVAAFPTAAVGSFCWVSGLLSLLCHVLLEPRVALSAQDLLLITVLGLGPMGAAFFLWDAALKRGDARQIGLLSFITPLASTLLLLVLRAQWPSWQVLAAVALVVGAALLGQRASRG